MSSRTRRTHSPSFKAKVALAAVRGDRMLAEQRRQTSVRRTAAVFGDYIQKLPKGFVVGRCPTWHVRFLERDSPLEMATNRHDKNTN